LINAPQVLRRRHFRTRCRPDRDAAPPAAIVKAAGASSIDIASMA
jgi:hypothetical protein